MKNQTIWFTSPAKSWEEALPIGNGHLGGMVYGGVSREQVDLNLDTLWSGTGRKKSKKAAPAPYTRHGKPFWKEITGPGSRF